MFALFARSICTHCLPGPSSTHEPSLPSLSPSTIMSNVPTFGLLSLAVTFLFLARLMVPAGTMKSGRLPFIGGSRFGTLRGTGVPTNNGGGSWVFRTTSFCARAAVAARVKARTERLVEKFLMMVSCSHFFGSDGNSGLRGDGVVRFVNRVLAAEGLIAGTVELCRTANGVEEILQVRLVRGLIEEDRNFILRQLGGFAHVHFRRVFGRSGLGADIAFLNQIVP